MDSQAGSFAKVTLPTLSGNIRRSRLFQLPDSECNRPVVWVFGSPGGEKSVLVRSYIEHLGWR